MLKLPDPLELAPWRGQRAPVVPACWSALTNMAAGLCWQYSPGRAPRWDPRAWADLRQQTLPMVCHAVYAAFVSDYNQGAAERYIKAHTPKHGQ